MAKQEKDDKKLNAMGLLKLSTAWSDAQVKDALKTGEVRELRVPGQRGLYCTFKDGRAKFHGRKMVTGIPYTKTIGYHDGSNLKQLVIQFANMSPADWEGTKRRASHSTKVKSDAMPTLHEIIDAYLVEGTGNLFPKTLSIYTAMAETVKREFPDRPCDLVARLNVAEYVLPFAKETPEGANGRRKIIGLIWKWAHNEKKIDVDITRFDRMKAFKSHKRQTKEPLTDKRLYTLFKYLMLEINSGLSGDELILRAVGWMLLTGMRGYHTSKLHTNDVKMNILRSTLHHHLC